MSRINTGSNMSTSMISFGVLLLVISTLITVVSASSSAIAWNNPMLSARHYDAESMSDLLLARTVSESHVLVKAKQLIQDLSSSTTCSHAPAVRLLQQCKNIKPKHENSQSDYQLSNAESVFAISMALCEANQARVTAPSACKIFRDLLERPVPESSIEIIRPNEIEACSAALYGTPAWTSYSTYKSNSRFLCETSRTDYQREELLQTLRDATDVIPEILDALIDHRTGAQSAMIQLRESAANIDAVQREILLHAQEQGQAHSAQLTQLSQFFAELKETMAEAVTENSKVLALNSKKASDVDDKLTRIYASFMEAATGLTFDLDQQISLLSQQTNFMLNQIHDLGAQDKLDNLRTTMRIVSQTAHELTKLQAEQVASGQEVLQAFNNFSPAQLLPRWLAGLVDWSVTLRTETPRFVLFSTPALGVLMFGRARTAVCVFFITGSIRHLWSQVSILNEMLIPILESKHTLIFLNEAKYSSVFASVFVILEALGWHNNLSFVVASYLTIRTSTILIQSYKHETLAILSSRQIQRLGVYLLIAFVICFCASVASKIVNSVYGQQTVVVNEVTEKRPKRDVKEDFERSRRACSVPLDFECA